MKILLCLILFFACFETRAQQYYAINGIVSDEKGKAIAGATVFITNSKHVTATNDEGKFSFSNIQAGSYEIVIKMLGFNPAIQNITIKDKPIRLSVTLTESNITLNTINITANRNTTSAAERENYLAAFMKFFIGETVNSQACKILNPSVITFHFDKDKKILRASADELLEVENKALGYKIKYLLTDFELNNETGMCTVGGSPYFEEMRGGFPQQREWNVKRRLAYLSSDRHFFNAVMDNRVTEEGFIVYKIIDKLIYFSERGKDDFLIHAYDTLKFTGIHVLHIDSLFVPDSKDAKTLVSSRKIVGKDTFGIAALYIVYTGAKESPLFYKTGGPLKLLNVALSPSQKIKPKQISQIQPLANKITIDRNSGLTPVNAFKYSGYWAWLKIADLTPLDYSIDPSDEQRTVNSLESIK
ncbi:carboxypeptidase-like regulatory domain-containing protein [Mucilaginibacter sp.]|uniref:carboxypeptidase-like regulatory domain-containing protein n=1 Tax=Mucilaginibacter sp. TaxID=1882438 RepID=UPI00261A1E46|nr:carboxypeptidase-like regulatory domain-containing protein [Mucilaginibacter sp.]MDB4926690.1 hypothetical protein [Mucilaginibacter sp.]